MDKASNLSEDSTLQCTLLQNLAFCYLHEAWHSNTLDICIHPMSLDLRDLQGKGLNPGIVYRTLAATNRSCRSARRVLCRSTSETYILLRKLTSEPAAWKYLCNCELSDSAFSQTGRLYAIEML